MKQLTTQEAAERLGVSTRRITALINSGKLPAERFGRAHVIKEADLRLVEERKPGRPPNTGVKNKTRLATKKKLGE